MKRNMMLAVCTAVLLAGLAVATDCRAGVLTVEGVVAVTDDIAVLQADDGNDYTLEGQIFLDGDVVRVTGEVEELESGEFVLHVIEMELLNGETATKDGLMPPVSALSFVG